MHVRSPAAALIEAPRIAWLDLARAGFAALGAAKARGFTHVLLAAPWQGPRRPDGVLAATFERVAVPGAADLAVLAAQVRREGLVPLLDVMLDRVALGADGPFRGASDVELLDPRRPADAEAARATAENEADAAALGAWWARHFAAWRRDGVAGFRLAGLDRLPPGRLASVLAPIRAATGDALLIATMPGVPRGAFPSLAEIGLDYTLSSLPWWDGKSPWLWEELDALGRVAPVLGAASFPGSPRFEAAAASLLAGALGAGWVSDAPDTDQAAAINAVLGAPGFGRTNPALPAGEAGPALALLRTDAADARFARHAALVLVPRAGAAPAALDPSVVMTALGGRFEPFRGVFGGIEAFPATGVVEVPATGAVFVAEALAPTHATGRVDIASAREAGQAPRLAVEACRPAVDAGAFPVKRVAGEVVPVEADVVFDGHEKIAVALQWRAPDDAGWQETPMRPLGNDRWRGAFVLGGLGRYTYRVVAWRDRYETFRDEVAKKHAAGVDLSLELREGMALVAGAARRAGGELRTIAAELERAADDARRETLLDDRTAALMAEADERPFVVHGPTVPVEADRLQARFASWYEVFPRSMSDDETRHGTFRDVERHLPRVRDMGFDVLYFPPIHPIGRKNRKGRNNSLTPSADDPGSPYAIGSEAGGHDAILPELGTAEDFRHLIAAAAAHGLEIAMDFAIQCAPDHPWLAEHPGWFDWRPDGTIKYAENPPKKYQDIVNVDFYAKDAVPGLWQALADTVLFWAGQGVRLFRVDNPHTKPFPFWEWMIGEVRRQYPDALFLAEAFTRPKIMYRLAKIGFSQSYTYFTWRNTKTELVEYMEELSDGPPADFFRPHFFVNTPDINPIFLQSSGRPGFLIRAALAATLSGLWGVYNGFELCEAAALPGREEYADSEKYQLRAWDWNRPGNIVAEITALNAIRRAHPALQTHRGVRFLPAPSDAVLVYTKTCEAARDTVLVAVSLDPHAAHETDFELPLWCFGLPDDAAIEVRDLLTGNAATWHGKYQHVRLTQDEPYRIWHILHA